MYYLLYEEYSEYNQFEGYWAKGWCSFKLKRVALATKEAYEKNSDYRDVVLTKVISPPKET